MLPAYGFAERKLSYTHRNVLNTSSRRVLYGEFVFLGGFIGNVSDYDGIASQMRGNINICENRLLVTSQIAGGEEFETDGIVYFVPQTDTESGYFISAENAADNQEAKPAGIITGSSPDFIEFAPFAQNTYQNFMEG